MENATQHRVLPPARIFWDSGQPVSPTFQDIYCDRSGAAEADRVFISPAKLAERCAEAGRITVAEAGFGLGLNFAAAAQRVLGASAGRLHYIAFEAAPPSPEDFARAARRSGIGVHRAFAAALPPRISGWHRRRFAAGRVQLSLYYGSIRAGLQELDGRQGRVDAWFLDGFAPPRNPEMWSVETCAAIARLSSPGTTVTTYSSAGAVKRALRNAGFCVSRIDQRPRKRHSLLAELPGAWRPQPAQPRRATVFGAGFAGCCAARALAERGTAVTIRDAAVAVGASAIPGAALHTRLLADGSAAAAWRAHSFAFAAWRYRGLPGVAATGALQLPGPNTDAARLARLAAALPEDWLQAVAPATATDIAGIPLRSRALHFPQAATISGPSLCAALLTHPGIEFVPTPLPGTSASGGGIAIYANGAAVTTGAAAAAAPSLSALEITALGGQANLFRATLKAPILGDGYFAPAADGGVWAGATYEYRPWLADAATAANGQRFRKLFRRAAGASLATFRGPRAVTSDRAPAVGRAAPDVYVTAGHGAAGLASAALAGEWIASLAWGECPPVSREVEALCRLERFQERQRRRPNPFRESAS